MKKLFSCFLFVLFSLNSEENNIFKDEYIYSIENILSLNKKEKEISKEDSLIFGIDISHYQKVYWDEVVREIDPPIEFVIVRATMGKDRKDTTYNNYYNKAKRLGFIVGSYHYYDPNENSKMQALNYLSSVKFSGGDLLPIVDIEKIGKQSHHSIKKGLNNFLKIIEDSCGLKPIIYTNFYFFKKYLEKDFSSYYFWSAFSPLGDVDHRFDVAIIHQFINNVEVSGIENSTDRVKVDGNYMRRSNLKKLIIKK